MKKHLQELTTNIPTGMLHHPEAAELMMEANNLLYAYENLPPSDRNCEGIQRLRRQLELRIQKLI